MNVILFSSICSSTETWTPAVNFIAAHGRDIQVAGFSAPDIGPYTKSDFFYTIEEVSLLYREHLIDGVVNIQSYDPSHYRLLEEHGIASEDIYVIPSTLTMRAELGEDISREQLLCPYRDMLPELYILEVHLADHCNLNCKGCAHFSNLVPEAVFPDIAQFEKDVARMSSLFSNIQKFFLLGGEPLLNPDFCDYVRIVRKYFPYTRLFIVTNGLLVPTLKEEQIAVLKENRVILSISAYPVLDVQKITDFTDRYQIDTSIRVEKMAFTKYLNPDGTSDKDAVFRECPRKECTFLKNGNIAACCQPFTVHYFNEYFDTHILENEYLNIYDADGWKILDFIHTPMESCRYCSPDVLFQWGLSKAPFCKDDWCV